MKGSTISLEEETLNAEKPAKKTICTERNISITDDVYIDVAKKLRDAIGNECYYNGTIDSDDARVYSTLTATLIIYREKEEYPEGVCNQIKDIVPVWWEYSTTVDTEGEILNDFSFTKLKNAILRFN